MDALHINQKQLARRWDMSHRTLEKWRWLGQGPAFLKIGGHVIYAMADVEAYERRHHRDLPGLLNKSGTGKDG